MEKHVLGIRRSILSIIAGIAGFTGPLANADGPVVHCQKAMKLVAEKNVQQLAQLADQKDHCAEHFLATMYRIGSGGLDADRAKAIELETRAAESGLDIAQYVLGLMYLGTPTDAPNYPEAIRWFRIAAEQGDVPSQTELGKMLIEGRHVEQDTVEGRRWLVTASEHGGQVAKELLEKLAKSPDGKSFPSQHRKDQKGPKGSD